MYIMELQSVYFAVAVTSPLAARCRSAFDCISHVNGSLKYLLKAKDKVLFLFLILVLLLFPGTTVLRALVHNLCRFCT